MSMGVAAAICQFLLNVWFAYRIGELRKTCVVLIDQIQETNDRQMQLSSSNRKIAEVMLRNNDAP